MEAVTELAGFGGEVCEAGGNLGYDSGPKVVAGRDYSNSTI